MPVYTYKCPEGHTRDMIHSIHDDPNPKCNKCENTMKRIPKTVTVTFKGSGFAANDK
ncbi:MAG: FmdB family transcriptional regulator [Actinobacteria bacterium]|nr:FmdB family transcriptional regulator [Actinomycetota bacterium]